MTARVTALLVLTAGLAWAGPSPQLPKWSADAVAAWIEAHPDPRTWTAATQPLLDGLQARHQTGGPGVFTSDPDFIPWLDHIRWARLAAAMAGEANDPSLAPALATLSTQTGATRLLVQNLSQGDDVPQAVRILSGIHAAHPESVRAYPALAVAFALVHDQPFPQHWPHHQVPRDTLPLGDETVAERFADYIRAQEAGELEIDPQTLTPQELKFAVDTRVQLAELAWARRETKYSTSKLERAFREIRYDFDRLRLGAFVWGGGPYTLANIQHRGGICTDQAYYAAQVGKARGIPTLYFTGQGADGGHAWFGHLQRPGKWNLDCGRYESQNYPIGHARDPQTWREINDSELELLVADLPRHPAYPAARAALAWARMNASSSGATLIRDARGILPALPDPWFAEEEWLVKSDAPPAARKAFYTEWIRQFDKQTDFKVHAQQKLLALLQAENAPEATALQKELVSQNRKKRFDLGIGAGADAIFTHIEAKRWPEAEKEFRRIVRRFDEQGGGNLFYQVVRPYVLTCAEDAQWDLAEDALDYVRKKMPIETGSILDREIRRLTLVVESRTLPQAQPE